MNYRLAVLTHGTHPKGDVLDRTMESFFEHVTPEPTSWQIHQDGVGAPRVHSRLGTTPSTFWLHGAKPDGFCASTARSWERAAKADEPYIFWLEHDFQFIRPVDLRELAAVLDVKGLAQMALMRDAYSAEEKAAGGLFEYRRDDFGERETCISAVEDDSPQPGFWEAPWLTMPWFTTNPCLMRRDFMAANPFLDDGEPFCEGRYGIMLREQGFEFGTWGSGEVWVKHIGVRTGHGY